MNSYMLQEFKVTSERGHLERWFVSDNMDLYVWFGAEGDISGFQICYDKLAAEHAFTWRASSGFSHAYVKKLDQGYAEQTFLLETREEIDYDKIALDYFNACHLVPPGISATVFLRLAEFSGRPPLKLPPVIMRMKSQLAYRIGLLLLGAKVRAREISGPKE